MDVPFLPNDNRKPAMGKTFEQLLQDPGAFTYHDGGFRFQYGELDIKVAWTEVKRMNAYKADLFTVDEVRLEIEYRDRVLTITEETPGWYQFVERTKQVFPSIPKDWDDVIVQPPFAENYWRVYERG